MITCMRAFIVLALLSLAACTAKPVPVHIPRELGADTRTVLTGDQAMALTHQCSRAAPGAVTGQWKPSMDEIDGLEETLGWLLSGQLIKAGVTTQPRNYYRQYAGFIIDGRRVIYINGVMRSVINENTSAAHPIDWRTQAINICDGGTLTFGAEYDDGTHQFSKFAFNGSP